jgi:adenine-specific DNA-methyltransferase
MRFLPYLGNKRKLIDPVLEALGSGNKMLDLFSGSGVVAYHLKENGITVHANDIAPYSYFINQTYLELTDDVKSMTGIIAAFNTLEAPKREYYFSQYYSENPDATKERLYYTRENGLFIDAVLERLWSVEWSRPVRSVVLCDLLYKMTTHANTSGIFKSYHKQIAGGKRSEGVHGRVYKSNHKKISSKIVLETPMCPNGPVGKAFQYDASEFFEKVDDCYDVVYIDPPYNAHQYSANYHLLEQACRPFNKRYVPKDNQKGGIQPDLYKSPYCSKKKYYETFRSLFDIIKERTKKIVVSYNGNGFMTKENMVKLLEEIGSVSITEIEYFNYRGGKQGKPRVSEYLFVV